MSFTCSKRADEELILSAGLGLSLITVVITGGKGCTKSTAPSRSCQCRAIPRQPLCAFNKGCADSANNDSRKNIQEDLSTSFPLWHADGNHLVVARGSSSSDIVLI